MFEMPSFEPKFWKPLFEKIVKSYFKKTTFVIKEWNKNILFFKLLCSQVDISKNIGIIILKTYFFKTIEKPQMISWLSF
jgi:hypothetical protein